MEAQGEIAGGLGRPRQGPCAGRGLFWGNIFWQKGIYPGGDGDDWREPRGAQLLQWASETRAAPFSGAAQNLTASQQEVDATIPPG